MDVDIRIDMAINHMIDKYRWRFFSCQMLFVPFAAHSAYGYGSIFNFFACAKVNRISATGPRSPSTAWIQIANHRGSEVTSNDVFLIHTSTKMWILHNWTWDSVQSTAMGMLLSKIWGKSQTTREVRQKRTLWYRHFRYGQDYQTWTCTSRIESLNRLPITYFSYVYEANIWVFGVPTLQFHNTFDITGFCFISPSQSPGRAQCHHHRRPKPGFPVVCLGLPTQKHACGPKTAHAKRVFLMTGVGWGGVGQDVTVMWTSAHLWCYATEIFSRLSYIFDATLGWGGVGWGKMLPSCERQHIFDATLPRSSLDFHTSLMLRYWDLL